MGGLNSGIADDTKQLLFLSLIHIYLAAKIPGSVWFNTFDEVVNYVMTHAEPGDLVITLGCGDIYKAAKKMMHCEG